MNDKKTTEPVTEHKPVQRVYTFPETGIVVKAGSLQEAVDKAVKQPKEKK